MGKRKKVGDDKDEVGKTGSPPSSTENEKAQEGERNRPLSVPKIGKDEVGGGMRGGGLH